MPTPYVDALIIALVSRKMFGSAYRILELARNPATRMQAWDRCRAVRDAAYSDRPNKTENMERIELSELATVAERAMAELYCLNMAECSEHSNWDDCPCDCDGRTVCAHVTKRTLARFA